MSHAKPAIQLKRAYDPPARDDGTRILVDRLWPRGLAREAAQIDLWLKEIAPSHELRHWFAHDRARFEEFSRRYRAELKSRTDATRILECLIDKGPVTLLFGARDREHNQARVIADWLSDTAPRTWKERL